VSGTPKLLARIKALFEPSRPTPPSQEAQPTLIPAAAAPEIAETYPPEPPTLFEDAQTSEDVPALSVETLAVAVEAPTLTEEAPTVPEEAAADDQPTAAVARPGALTLRLESERGSRSTFEVTKAGATIGRGPESTIQLADLSVSRKHARITYKQGSYWLSDLGSMGGTWIDGAKLAAPRRVVAGQTIDIGLCRLVVVAAAEGEKSGAAKGPSNAA
jgi:hypothetical protein